MQSALPLSGYHCFAACVWRVYAHLPTLCYVSPFTIAVANVFLICLSLCADEPFDRPFGGFLLLLVLVSICLLMNWFPFFLWFTLTRGKFGIATWVGVWVFLYVLGAMYRKCLLGWIGSERDAMRATEKQGVRERSIICKDPPEDEPWRAVRLCGV